MPKGLLYDEHGKPHRRDADEVWASIHHGQAILVSRHPLVAECNPRAENYHEEASHMQGTITEGCHRGLSGASRWQRDDRPTGQPIGARSPDGKYSRGKRQRAFVDRSVHELTEAERNTRKAKHEWLQQRGYEAA